MNQEATQHPNVIEPDNNFVQNWCRNSINPNILANQKEFTVSLSKRNKGLKHAEELLGKLQIQLFKRTKYQWRERLARTPARRKTEEEGMLAKRVPQRLNTPTHQPSYRCSQSLQLSAKCKQPSNWAPAINALPHRNTAQAIDTQPSHNIAKSCDWQLIHQKPNANIRSLTTSPNPTRTTNQNPNIFVLLAWGFKWDNQKNN